MTQSCMYVCTYRSYIAAIQSNPTQSTTLLSLNSPSSIMLDHHRRRRRQSTITTRPLHQSQPPNHPPLKINLVVSSNIPRRPTDLDLQQPRLFRCDVGDNSTVEEGARVGAFGEYFFVDGFVAGVLEYYFDGWRVGEWSGSGGGSGGRSEVF